MRESPHGSRIVKDEDKIRQFKSDLPSKPSACGRNRRGSRPRTICEPSDNDARPESGGAKETRLENGEDGETLQRKVRITVRR